uniref:uncharacterized protein n=1 Tax=Myxine glutinosa TaxID=7769 RepID=UPI00358E8398
MPKQGLTPSEWRRRLREYASGAFHFGRGQRPPKGSRWGNEITKIDSCSRHGRRGCTDLFGNRVWCKCSYHVPLILDTSELRSSKDAGVGAMATTSSTSAVPISQFPPMASTTSIPPMLASTHPPVHPPSVPLVPYSSFKAENATKLMFPTNYGEHLPAGWGQNVDIGDKEWIGKALFVEKGRLKDSLSNWNMPPELKRECSTQPRVEVYFHRRLFLWMPRKMWSINFYCPKCPNRPSLRSKGLYNRVRLVLDLRDYYYLAAEYMDCGRCKGTFIAYDSRLLEQLADGPKSVFPALLTYKYACDRAVVSLLRSRTLGNSPTALQHNLQELHSEEWLRKQMRYLSDCRQHMKGLQGMHIQPPRYQEAPAFKILPNAKWFLASYVRDVWGRLPEMKASITSTFGAVLKIDATKKVCKKLQGETGNSASWCMNIGNENGEILLSIITTSEACPTLKDMANGLMDRYQKAGKEPPKLLYTDRDCCSMFGPSKFAVLFNRWEDIEVRLDIWHFMRRLALGCTTESHPLYGTFMARLSHCIFEWDKADVDALAHAKKSEMVKMGLSNPSESAVHKAITREELARHCRRRTRGAEKTKEAVEELILSMSSATDSLGVCLLKEEMKTIWEEQKRHAACIQDVSEISLYTITGHVTKGTEMLPVFRCARGSTSLENFHLHLARFIPGTAANSVNFQAYLLDGVTRWNAARAAAAIDVLGNPFGFRTFDTRLQNKLNELSQEVHQKDIFPHYVKPGKSTDEKIGIEYLLHQSGLILPQDEEEINSQIDEGFEEFDDLMCEEKEPTSCAFQNEDLQTFAAPNEDKDDDEDVVDEEVEEDSEESVDAKGIPGWDKVDKLAQALVELSGLCVTNAQAKIIKSLYGQLVDYDTRPLIFKARVRNPPSGRFARMKGSSGHFGVEAVKRCFLAAGSPASCPSKSRIVEAICIRLCDRYTQPKREHGYVSRWKLILSSYNGIKQRLLNSEALLEGTDLVLFSINETTLTRWYKKTARINEVRICLQGKTLPGGLTCASTELPEARRRPTSKEPPADPHVFEEPQDTTGEASKKRKPAMATALHPTAEGSASVAAAERTEPVVSRTTAWRKRRMELGGSYTSKVSRKQYTCRVCGRPMTAPGHTQFRGQRYCPHAQGQISKEQWLAERKAASARARGGPSELQADVTPLESGLTTT